MEQLNNRFLIKPSDQGVMIVKDSNGVAFEDLSKQLTQHPDAQWQLVNELERYRIAKRLKQVKRLPVTDVSYLDELLQPPLLMVQDRIGQDFQYRLELIATADHGAEFYFDYQLGNTAEEPQANRGKIQLSQQEIVGLLNFFKL